MALFTHSPGSDAVQDVPETSSVNPAVSASRPSSNPLRSVHACSLPTDSQLIYSSQGPCRRCCYHLGRWKEGMEKPSCTTTPTASNKCSRCVREKSNYEGGKPCLYMDPGHRSICRRLETKIAEPFPNMAVVRRLQVLCRKFLQEYKGREKKQSEKGKSKADSTILENTSPTASDSTPGVTDSRAREILSSQIKLDIANSLHSLSFNLAAMAQHFGVRGTVMIPAREGPSTWDGILQAEHDLVHGISEEPDYDEENEEGLSVEEGESEMDISS